MKYSPFAGVAASFAHLAGRRPSGKRAEETDRKDKESKRAEEGDEDEKAEDDENEEKAEDDDADAKAEDPDDEDEKAGEDEDEEKAKKAKAKGKTYAAGRADERKRCAAIFASEHAAGLPHVAAQLAFTTGLSASEAIAVMAGVAITNPPQGKRGGLADRMATTAIPNVGDDGGKKADASTPAGMAAKMTAVYDRLTGTKK